VFLTDSQGAPAATASAWTDAETGAPILHWVSTAPRRQGRGLGRAATQHALYLHHKLAPGAAISLHTQTWSHKAVLLYASLGFRMVQGKTPVCGKPNEYDQAMAVLRRVYPPGVSHALEEQALRADEF
ncbi:MAG: GNAT family N-acetyltransferase, partial [Clostridiales bacterium]|nr:GNAT family N-acetyltransferase [Clostridiales bacterium]